MEETRIRFIHQEDRKTKVRLLSNFEDASGTDWALISVGASDSKAVVMERLIDNKVSHLKLLHINNVGTAPRFFREYQAVRVLEISCPVPVTFIFRHLPLLKNLTSFRLRKQTFSKIMGPDDSSRNWAVCPKVDTFQISFDVALYNSLPGLGRRFLDLRIASTIRLGQTTFPQLKRFRLRVPKSVERVLDSFVHCYSNLPSRAEKLTCPDGSVILSNMDPNEPVMTEDELTQSEFSVDPKLTLQSIKDLKKPLIRFQSDSEDDGGMRSEPGALSSTPLRGILKFFMSRRFNDSEGGARRNEVHKARRTLSCPPRKH